MNPIFFHIAKGLRFLKRSFQQDAQLQVIIGNINWLLLENIARNVLGIVVFAVVARYLGPEQFGVLNYALALVTLFSMIATLGLDQIVIRNIVSHPEKSGEYLGSASLLKLIGSLFLVIVVAAFTAFLHSDEPLLLLFILITAFGYVFKSLDTIDLWFQSQVKSKYSVFVRSTAFALSSVIKIIMVILHAPLIAFVIMFAFESFIALALFLYLYSVRGGVSLRHWTISPAMMRVLLKDSWPLILTGLAVTIYMRIDQVMIGAIAGNEQLGIFSTAVKISEAWYFLPVVITGSVFPAIINAKKKSRELYLKRLQILYDGFVWFTIPIALVVTFLSPLIIRLFFGAEFSAAAPILSIHIWSAIFAFTGVVAGQYLIAENLTKYSLSLTLIGAITNILLNLVLIPLYGILGAAIASLFASVLVILSLGLFAPTRIAIWQILNSFNFFRIFRKLKLP